MPEVPDAFFVPVDDGVVRATVHTTGPWDTAAQHAGPPAALLAGAMQATVPTPLARLTFEILRPVPITTLRVSATVVRPGRRVTLVEGVLEDDDGPCLLGRAWGIRTADVGLEVPAPEPALAGPENASGAPFFDVGAEIGWHTAMELRFLAGNGFNDLGPAVMWGRPRVDLVAGRRWRPMERVVVLADAGNGASASADVHQWMFINTELSVHLTRHPAGEWVALDAHSVYDPHGVGAAFSTVHDERGPIGRAAQSLFLGPRPER